MVNILGFGPTGQVLGWFEGSETLHQWDPNEEEYKLWVRYD